MLDFVSFPIGKTLRFIYDVFAFKNYGVALYVYLLLSSY